MVNLLPSPSIIGKACVSWPLDSLIAWSLDSLIPSPVSCLPLIPREVEKAAHVGDAFARDGPASAGNLILLPQLTRCNKRSKDMDHATFWLRSGYILTTF